MHVRRLFLTSFLVIASMATAADVVDQQTSAAVFQDLQVAVGGTRVEAANRSGPALVETDGAGQPSGFWFSDNRLSALAVAELAGELDGVGVRPSGRPVSLFVYSNHDTPRNLIELGPDSPAVSVVSVQPSGSFEHNYFRRSPASGSFELVPALSDQLSAALGVHTVYAMHALSNGGSTERSTIYKFEWAEDPAFRSLPEGVDLDLDLVVAALLGRSSPGLALQPSPNRL